MKKLLVITDVILVLTAVILIFAVRHDIRPAIAPTVLAEEMTPEEEHIAPIDVEQIQVGNFESIYGYWMNPESDIADRKVYVLENTVAKNGRNFNLRYGGINGQTGQVYLWMYLKGIAPENGSRFEMYPKGTAIPVKLADGSIDYTGKHDPTFKEKDRIVMEGSARTVEELKSLVLYRDTEEKYQSS
ncbi:hypothetical protein AALM99_11730 [Lactococcus muris]|uniref:Uncharacterized protein n=1 Tax=Lactococcus muris TaxID=2941330 RepID=A0ABV4DDC2_9LACT